MYIGNKDGLKKQIILKEVKKTEEYTYSLSLGLNGGIDVRFEADIYPDITNKPNEKFKREVIIELKTGRKKEEHMHQTMCYLMTHYGLNAFENYGFVLYSDKDKLNSFLFRAVEPNLKYFCDIVLHRNFYMLNNKFYEEYKM